MQDYKQLTVRQIRDGLSAKQFSARELADAAFAEIEAQDKDIHAFLELTPELAFTQADKIDAAVAAGEALGNLAGVPIAFKDNMNLTGTHTTCASRMLETYVSPYDATCVANAINAGGIPIGKTNMDEFAFGSSTETSYFGKTMNPWDLERVPGGSSGGSAACVAAGMTTVTQCYSVRGLDVVAGLNIATTITNLFNIVYIQLGACISIVVGQYLGAGELEKAKDADNKMIVFSVFCCVIMAAIMFLVGGFFPDIYNTTAEIKDLATKFIAVSALIMPFCSFSHASYFTLRSGGKTMVTFLFDSVFTWVVVVPVAFLLAHGTGLGIVSVYFLVQATELIKVVIGYCMVRSNVWVVKMV